MLFADVQFATVKKGSAAGRSEEVEISIDVDCVGSNEVMVDESWKIISLA